MLLNDETKQELLQHFPKESHELLLKQIMIIEETINNYAMEYKYSKDFNHAINIVLNDILQGKYLGRNPIEE